MIRFNSIWRQDWSYTHLGYFLVKLFLWLLSFYKTQTRTLVHVSCCPASCLLNLAFFSNITESHKEKPAVMLIFFADSVACLCVNIYLNSPQCVWAPSLGWHQPVWWSLQLVEEPGRCGRKRRRWTWQNHPHISSWFSSTNYADVNICWKDSNTSITSAVDTHLIGKLLTDQRHYQWCLPHFCCMDKWKTLL